MNCPRCSSEMTPLPCAGGRIPRCLTCRGCAITVEMLRRFAPKDRIDAAWRDARDSAPKSALPCPSCEAKMRRVALPTAGGAELELDACVHCHIVWFDASELERFSPDRQEPLTAAERAEIHDRLGVVGQAGPMRENPISDVAEIFSLFMR